jgi:hypothetical protein
VTTAIGLVSSDLPVLNNLGLIMNYDASIRNNTEPILLKYCNFLCLL